MTARSAARIRTTDELDRLVSEADFQATIIEIAHHFRWEPHHQFDSRRSQPGWPDLVLLKPPQAIFAELKTETGKVSAAQARAIEQLADCGFEVAVWRPSQLDEIIARLQENRR